MCQLSLASTVPGSRVAVKARVSHMSADVCGFPKKKL